MTVTAGSPFPGVPSQPAPTRVSVPDQLLSSCPFPVPSISGSQLCDYRL